MYKGIDVFKFIMAIFVVILHTHPLYAVNDTLNFFTTDVAARAAVPFFFAATGFLLEKQINDKDTVIKEAIGKYVRKVLGLYCVWTIIYLPIIIYDRVIDSDESLIRGVLTIVRDFVFVGSYAHLWYLPAAAVGVIIVYALRKYTGEQMTAIILLVLFFMGLLTQSYFGLLVNIVGTDDLLWTIMKAVKKIMVTCRNGVFFGSIFIYMGTWIAKRNAIIKGWKAVVGLIASLLFFGMEVSYLWTAGYVREQDMYLMLLPSVFFLLMFAVQMPVKGETIFLRKMSMNIYYVHIIFKFIYEKFMRSNNEYNIALFLFTLIGALITAYVMYRLEYLMKTAKCKV